MRAPTARVAYNVRCDLVEDPSDIPVALHCMSHALPQSSEAFLLYFP